LTKLQQIASVLRKPIPEDFHWHFVTVYNTDEYTMFGVRHSTGKHHLTACGDAIGLGVHVGLLPQFDTRYSFEYIPELAQCFGITSEDFDDLFVVPRYIPAPDSLPITGYSPAQIADGIDRFISGQPPIRRI
jgi:hypothetical protein